MLVQAAARALLERRPIRLAGLVALALGLGIALAVLPLNVLGLGAAAALVVAAGIAILAEPALGLALTLIAGPFEPLEQIRLGLPIDSGQALFALTLVAYALRALGARGIPIAPAGRSAVRFSLPILVFIGVGALSFIPATDGRAWLKEVVKWIEVVVVLVLTAIEARQPRIRALLIGALFLVAAGEAVFGMYQFALRGTGPAEFALAGGRFFRASGTLEQPNPFGGYMGLSWPIAFAFACAWLAEPARLALRRDWAGVRA
ncbi:MAG: hypothetical protein K1X39_14545, partial [Thermoflexales bacterium]|nr:hypothetical protein [Thermoflexales bacterium]